MSINTTCIIYISFRFVIKAGARSPRRSPCRYDSTLRHAFRSPQLMENAAESGTKLPKHCSVDRGKSHYVGSGCHVKTINNHNLKLPAEMNHSASNRSCLSPLNINLDPKQWPIQRWKKFDRQWRAKSLQFKERDILSFKWQLLLNTSVYPIKQKSNGERRPTSAELSWR